MFDSYTTIWKKEKPAIQRKKKKKKKKIVPDFEIIKYPPACRLLLP